MQQLSSQILETICSLWCSGFSMGDKNPSPFANSSPSITQVTSRSLIFVTGKGGVGKTAVSLALAKALSEKEKRILWVTFEDPNRPAGELRKLNTNLWHLNCDAGRAFEEYATLKIGISKLAQIFVGNKLMQYLSKAAPGIHELVLLGKIWHDRKNYDQLVIDMPSTGYGLAMFQSTQNFARLFKGGPVHKDAEAMLETFGSPKETGYIIVSLPEETPLRESLELSGFLSEIFPENPPAFIANRLFPQVPGLEDMKKDPMTWDTPLAADINEYITRRLSLESHNLRLWRDEKINFFSLDFIPPPLSESLEPIVEKLALQFHSRGFA